MEDVDQKVGYLAEIEGYEKIESKGEHLDQYDFTFAYQTTAHNRVKKKQNTPLPNNQERTTKRRRAHNFTILDGKMKIV